MNRLSRNSSGIKHVVKLEIKSIYMLNVLIDWWDWTKMKIRILKR